MQSFVFSKLRCSFSWLAGRFHNFELTQNREKARNGPSCKLIDINWYKALFLAGHEVSKIVLLMIQILCHYVIRWFNLFKMM
jgi:hypothetical protein